MTLAIIGGVVVKPGMERNGTKYGKHYILNTLTNLFITFTALMMATSQ